MDEELRDLRSGWVFVVSYKVKDRFPLGFVEDALGDFSDFRHTEAFGAFVFAWHASRSHIQQLNHLSDRRGCSKWITRGGRIESNVQWRSAIRGLDSCKLLSSADGRKR